MPRADQHFVQVEQRADLAGVAAAGGVGVPRVDRRVPAAGAERQVRGVGHELREQLPVIGAIKHGDLRAEREQPRGCADAEHSLPGALQAVDEHQSVDEQAIPRVEPFERLQAAGAEERQRTVIEWAAAA